MPWQRFEKAGWGPISIGILIAVVGGVGWFGSDALERDNDFCNACHLTSEVPLHIGIRRDFDAIQPTTLAAVHGGAMQPVRAERPATRCIDCHGGVGLVGKAKVKLLAAKDALVWLSGDFEEPTRMNHPLGEADCRQCHMKFEDRDDATSEAAFHELAVHNIDLGVTCVECHTVHDGGDDAALVFLDAERVRSQCARCHSEFRR